MIVPFTETKPAVIYSSASLREQMPELAINLFSLTRPSSLFGAEGVFLTTLLGPSNDGRSRLNEGRSPYGLRSLSNEGRSLSKGLRSLSNGLRSLSNGLRSLSNGLRSPSNGLRSRSNDGRSPYGL